MGWRAVPISDAVDSDRGLRTLVQRRRSAGFIDAAAAVHRPPSLPENLPHPLFIFPGSNSNPLFCRPWNPNSTTRKCSDCLAWNSARPAQPLFWSTRVAALRRHGSESVWRSDPDQISRFWAPSVRAGIRPSEPWRTSCCSRRVTSQLGCNIGENLFGRYDWRQARLRG